MFDRRDFIQATLRSALLTALSGGFLPELLMRRAWADGTVDGAEPHHFLLLRTFGGMDAVLGLDPWTSLPTGADEKDLYLDYRPESVFTAPAGLRLGPAAQALIPHAGDLLTLNGVMMRRDAGHETLNAYMASGQGDGSAAVLPVELACCTPAGPFGVLMEGSAFVGTRSVVLSSLTEMRSLAPGGDAAALFDLLMLAYERADTPLGQAGRKYVAARESSEALVRTMDAFRKTLGSASLQPYHTAAAAFASGAARQGIIDLDAGGQGLDSHSDYSGQHLTAQKQVWDKVADIFSFFKSVPVGSAGKSLFDHTTFMVITEFSRTPFLNAAKGKDHNPFTNSVLLAGKNVRGGTTVGASKLFTRKQRRDGQALHIAAPFDYRTGRVTDQRDGANFIFPENVAATVAALFGSPAGFSSVGSELRPVPGIVKT